MCPISKSIASIAVCLVHSLALAGPAMSPAGERETASSVFADSFGLNVAARTAALKPESVLTSPGQVWTPAADSFGLNRPLISTPADCPVADAQARPQPDPRRCIRM